MGRELKRVPLDFSWPLNKVWSGFVNPHYKKCPQDGVTCLGGSTVADQWLDSIVRFLELLAEQGEANTPENVAFMRAQGRTYPHPYLARFEQAPTYRSGSYYSIVPPDQELARVLKLFAGLKPDAKLGLCGDHLGSSLAKAIKKTAKLPEKWGYCPVCDGSGQDPASKEAYDAWEETPVPTGPGYQVWETVSEGSPVSPVFATADGLEHYLVNTSGHSRESARAFIESGWVPSMVIRGGVAYQGIDSADK